MMATNSGPMPVSGPASDERTWAMLCHLSSFVGYVFVIPFASIIGPLVVWLLKKDSSEFVNENGKESLNFHLTIAVAYLMVIVSCFLLIGFLLLPIVLPFLAIWVVVLTVVACIKSLNGERFHYPLSIRFLK